MDENQNCISTTKQVYVFKNQDFYSTRQTQFQVTKRVGGCEKLDGTTAQSVLGFKVIQ